MRPAPKLDPALLQACTGAAPIVCTWDLPAGHYDVTVMLGDRRAAARTQVSAEARRMLVPTVATDAGELARRTFTVNVRTPESQQNGMGGEGTPGLTLTFEGDAPAVAGIGITAAPAATTPRLFLAGDSTVTDQGTWPYAGWGQRIGVHFRHGLSLVNHSGSGESTVSFLAQPALWDSLERQLRPGDVVLIQLAHNDKETDAATYRANLAAMVERARARGATPALVTPIVRHRFSGGQLNSTGLIVNGLGVDLPAEMRAVAAGLGAPLIDLTAMSQALVEGLGATESEPIYLVRINRDRTHTSEHGADVYAGLVAQELRRLRLVPDKYWR